MRWVVFSDVHGNQYAFREFMKLQSFYAPDLFLFCGDLCGYYYGQMEVIEMMQSGLKAPLVCLLGNHDQYFINALKDSSLLPELTEKYGSSYRELCEHHAGTVQKFLDGLKPSQYFENEKILAVHGSPESPLNGYVYPDTDLSGFGQKFQENIVFMGHTHYPMHRQQQKIRYLNPGSLGQPRDYNAGSFGVYNFDNDEFEIVRFTYDHESLIQEVQKRNEKNQYLHQVLRRVQ